MGTVSEKRSADLSRCRLGAGSAYAHMGETSLLDPPPLHDQAEQRTAVGGHTAALHDLSLGTSGRDVPLAAFAAVQNSYAMRKGFLDRAPMKRKHTAPLVLSYRLSLCNLSPHAPGE
jgi:hypothetical protein